MNIALISHRPKLPSQSMTNRVLKCEKNINNNNVSTLYTESRTVGIFCFREFIDILKVKKNDEHYY